MSMIQFAADAAGTPVSKLRQEAKALSREAGITLSHALDKVAIKSGFDRWDHLISQSWSLFPKGSEEITPDDYHHTAYADTDLGHLIVKFPAKDASDAEAIAQHSRLITTLKDAKPNHMIFFSDFEGVGRKLKLSDDILELLKPSSTLQNQARGFLSAAKQAVNDTPMFFPKIKHDANNHASETEFLASLTQPRDYVCIIVGIPDSKDSLELNVPLLTSASDVIGSFSKYAAAGLSGFKVQKDGSIMLRRSHVSNESDAYDIINKASKTLSLLNWAGLMFGNERDQLKAQRDYFAFKEARDKSPFDHLTIMIHEKTSETVVFNEPYPGHSDINRYGIENLLSSKTSTIELPPFAGFKRGRPMFHTFRDNGVDLERLAENVMAGVYHLRDQELRRVSSVSNSKKESSKMTTTATNPKTKTLISPVLDIHFPFDSLNDADKYLLLRHLPDIETLQKPYTKVKMKAFKGKGLLSEELLDKYESDGITNFDLIDAIKACPLDADLWGMANIFDFTDDVKVEMFRRGVVAGEIYLGRKMKDYAGDFWSFLETRGYMRTMNLLYRQLVKMRRPAEALPIGKMMLKLCPNDNIGIRFSIESVEAAFPDPDAAADLAEAFEDQDADAKLA